MFVASAADFRKDLKIYLDKVTDNFEPLIVHRGKGAKDVVVISLEEYNSLRETNYLLSNSANARRLFDSIQQHKEGKANQRPITEE